MQPVPSIETARLLLRAHRYDDFPESLAMWSDPSVTRFIGGRPSTEQQTWSRMLSYAGHWALMGFGYWAIQEKASGRFAGDIGFANFKRDIAESMRNSPELGFALAPAFHGIGYATEAVRGALSWADAQPGWKRTVCLINPENAASLRVVRKCGYELVERSTYNGQPVLFLARDC